MGREREKRGATILKKKIFSREEAAPARTIFFVLKLRDKKKRVVREPQPLSVFLIRSDWNSIHSITSIK